MLQPHAECCAEQTAESVSTSAFVRPSRIFLNSLCSQNTHGSSDQPVLRESLHPRVTSLNSQLSPHRPPSTSGEASALAWMATRPPAGGTKMHISTQRLGPECMPSTRPGAAAAGPGTRCGERLRHLSSTWLHVKITLKTQGSTQTSILSPKAVNEDKPCCGWDRTGM